jgi:hypothetical protein
MFNLGAFFFGLVIGWVTYRTLRRTKTNGLSDIATVIGAVGGAAILKLFPAETNAFGAYSIGLAVGFFAYLIISGYVETRASKNKAFKRVSRFLGSETVLEGNQDEDEDLPELPIAGR